MACVAGSTGISSIRTSWRCQEGIRAREHVMEAGDVPTIPAGHRTGSEKYFAHQISKISAEIMIAAGDAGG
ncbi:hypothetical protein X732_31335 [Mesorhizobium sp. L2C066B000]|nr:hypothetical protein X732_31335 [Mesorhizobium sp. L2C066B000]